MRRPSKPSARRLGRPGRLYGLAAVLAVVSMMTAAALGVPAASRASTTTPPTITPTSLSFGDQAVGTTSAAQTVTVSNNDLSSDLVIYSDSIPSGSFQISSDSCDHNNVSPARSCQISVELAPTVAVGPTSATLSILEGFSGGATETRTVALTGTASGPPAVTTQPANQTVDPGQTASFTAAASAYPTATEQWQVSIDGGTSWSDIAGATSGTYSLTTTAADNQHQYRAMFSNDLGTATSNAAVLTLNTVTSLSISPTALAFGNQVVNTTSAPHSVTLTNSGTTDIHLTPASFSLSAGGATGINFDDATTTCLDTTVSPGSSCVLALTFQPPALGPVSATLDITYGGASPAQLGLTGNGVPAVSISPAALDFGDQALGYLLDVTPVTLTNNLPTALQVSGASVVGADASDFLVNTNPDPGTCFAGPVAPGSSCQVPVQFTPSVVGPRSASLQITDNSPGGQETVPLAGTGISVVTASPTSVSFPDQFVGAIPSQFPTVTVTNNGSDVVNITGATILGDTADFGTTLQSCGNYGLEHGVTCTVVVYFAPKTAGPHTATLEIADDAGSPVDVVLSGTGLTAVAPSITTQPGDQSVVAGQVATFTAAATGIPSPTAQWQVSTNGGSTWSDVPGATSATYSFTTAPGDNDNRYRAVFSSSVGVATTDAATLTVSSAPAVIIQPVSQTVIEGQAATFTAAATGNPTPTVVWQYSSDGGQTWNPLTGETSPTLTLASVSTNESGNQLRAVFTNNLGFVATNPAVLTVNPIVPPAVTGQPASQTVNTGQTVTFIAGASGTPAPNVQWQASTDGGKTFVDLPGATASTLTFPAVDADNGNLYRATFSNSGGSVTTDAASLTVTPIADVAVTKTGPAAAVAGTDVTYTITATNNGPSQAQNVGLIDTLPPGTTFVSFTSPAGWTSATPGAGGTGTITSTASTLANGATAAFSLVVHLDAGASGTVTNTASVSSTTGDPNATNDSSTATATVSNPAADLAVTKTGPAAATAGTDLTYTIGTTNGGPDGAQNAKVTDTLPAGTTFVSFTSPAGWTSTTPVSGGTGTITSTASTLANGATAAFSLVVHLDAGASGTVTNAASVSSDTRDTNSANNTSSATTTIDTAPAITTQPADQSVVEGQTATFSAAASGVPAPTVSWQVSTDAGKTFTDVPGATSPTYSFAATLVQSGNRYRARFTNVAGSATSNGASLSVAPILTAITVAPGGSTLAPGMTQAYTATGHFSNGTTKDLTTSVTWASSAPAVASVSPTGLAKAIVSGGTDLTAALGAVSGHVVLTVSPLRLVWVQPWLHFLSKGSKLGYVATGVFADGTVEPITSHVTWSSTNLRAAVVSPQGVVTGRSRGSALVFARFGQALVIPGVVVVR